MKEFEYCKVKLTELEGFIHGLDDKEERTKRQRFALNSINELRRLINMIEENNVL